MRTKDKLIESIDKYWSLLMVIVVLGIVIIVTPHLTNTPAIVKWLDTPAQSIMIRDIIFIVMIHAFLNRSDSK